MRKFTKQCILLYLLIGFPCLLLCSPKQKEYPKPLAKTYIKLPR